MFDLLLRWSSVQIAHIFIANSHGLWDISVLLLASRGVSVSRAVGAVRFGRRDGLWSLCMSMQMVAKLAGVSTSTVSRVVNDDPRVAAATAEIVRRAMK